MEYLIRFIQTHETFRLAEIQALADLEKIDLAIVFYDPDSPYCIVRLADEAAAQALIRRSILTQTIHELWGQGATLADLHADLKVRSQLLGASKYATVSFKFELDSFRGSRTAAVRLSLFDSFDYLPLDGPIQMQSPEHEFTLFEHWAPSAVALGLPDPERNYFGRLVGGSARGAVRTFDLKKRRYISTTSMDPELALVTANIALAAPGKLFYDPFAGTGSFPLAAAQWGAVAWASDIDGRTLRGDEREKTLQRNFEQYGLLAGLGGMFVADLTNSPVRRVPPVPGGSASSPKRLFDGIICDPPYGVREGLRVLGCRDKEKRPWVVEAGIRLHKDPDFVPPRQPYSFLAMLDDILVFAADTLVDDGRLAFWMPTANDEAQEIAVPKHPCLEIVAVCSQTFAKWSRRLIAYRRIPDSDVDPEALATLPVHNTEKVGLSADELNPFRRGYFNKFIVPSATPG